MKPVKFKTQLVRTFADSGWHFLTIEKKIADKFPVEEKSRRVVCKINDGEPFQCALLPWGESFYIIVNKKKRDALGIDVGDTVTVELTKDESKYGLPMPAEFAEVLKQDKAGSKLFHALTKGKQRSLIYAVSNVKDIDKRIHTALAIMDHIHKNNGKVIDKELYEELKRPVADL